MNYYDTRIVKKLLITKLKSYFFYCWHFFIDCYQVINILKNEAYIGIKGITTKIES